MNVKQVTELVVYWKKAAKHDYITMRALFRSKRYSDCLFFGHIVLEKMLKGHVVKKTKKQAPYTHNLLYLHDLARLQLLEQDLDLLDIVNDFNIRARYPEQKFLFYKQCTRLYTINYLGKIVALYKMLCRTLK